MRRFGWLVFVVLLSVTGCQGDTRWPWSPTPTPTPTPTATPTPTPTATPTATPTPTPTATPTPTPTPTPPPARLALRVEPQTVEQGRTLELEVTTDRPLTVTGRLDAAPLTFQSVQGAAWAIVGIPLDATPGPRDVRLLARDDLGRPYELTASVQVTATERFVFSFVLPMEKQDLISPEVVEPEQAAMRALWSVTTPRWWGGRMRVPLVQPPPVLSPFGQYRVYNGGALEDFHTGTDYPVPAGTQVVAAGPGRVAAAESLRIRGNTVWIDHGWGVYSGYFHLTTMLVEVGEGVVAGQPIGTVGTTGRSTGPHLHWEMRVGGVAVDPLEWIQRQIGPPP